MAELKNSNHAKSPYRGCLKSARLAGRLGTATTFSEEKSGGCTQFPVDSELLRYPPARGQAHRRQIIGTEFAGVYPLSVYIELTTSMKRHLSKIFTCLLLLAWLQGYSDSKQLEFDRISIEQGLSESLVRCIYQDSRGFLWLGTKKGLNLYDGKSFTVYLYKEGENSISGDHILCITEDFDGNIWIGTKGLGLNKYDVQKHVFTRYVNDPKFRNSLSDNTVLSLAVDEKGTLWVGTGNGLNHFDKHTESFERVDLTAEGLNKTPRIINTVTPDVYGNIWVGTDMGLLQLQHDATDVELHTWADGANKFSGNQKVRTVFQDRSGVVWVGTNGGLRKLNGYTNKFELVQFNDTGLVRNDVHALAMDKEGYLWIGTFDAGLIKLDVTSLSALTYRNIPGNHRSLSNNSVISLFIDKTGLLWAGTFIGGLNKANLSVIQFNSLNQGNSSLAGDDIYDVLIDTQGNMWFATGNGVSVFPFDYDWQNLRAGKRETRNWLEYSTISCLMEDSSKALWIGTSGEGIYKLDYQDGSRKPVKIKVEGSQELERGDIFCMLEDRKRNVWIGTSEGAFVMNANHQVTKHYVNDPTNHSSLSDNEVFCIYEDSRGYIWIGTFSGLNRYNEGNDDFIYYRKDGKQGDFSQIMCLAEDSKANLWVGTEDDGVWTFNPDNDKRLILTSIDGLPDNSVTSIIEDHRGFVWLSSSRGLCRVKQLAGSDLFSIHTYNTASGIPCIDFNFGACVRTSYNKLFFGCSGGAVFFDPDLVISNPLPPPVFITNFEISFEKVEVTPDGSGPLSKHISSTDKINLDYTQNNLDFEFTALSYTHPERNQYAFMMEGYDAKWLYFKKHRSGTYTNLDPGEYVFRVKASNDEGIWNETGKSISIVITPPFWRTGWFYALSVIAIILSVVSYIKWREKRLKEEKQQLEKEVANRTQEVTEQMEIVEHQNKEILASLHYAQKIQMAILPEEDFLNSTLADHFVLFKPRDIVSGDFFWVSEKKGKKIVVAADCTGHGVPGAFMSMIGNSFLNQIINEDGITKTSEILNKLKEEVIIALKQKGQTGESQDGMDLSIYTLDIKKRKLEYAGANIPIYIIRNKEIIEFKGDKQPIGIHYGKEKTFNSTNIKVHQGDAIYTFSDGFKDQFGGPEGKKFKSKQFKELLLSISSKPMKDQKEAMGKTLAAWMGEEEQVDDILVMGVRVN